MPNETVTYDLASELREIKSDIKQILNNQTKFDSEIKALQSDIATIKDTQSKQIWALIGVLATGVVGALIINSWKFWTTV